MLFLRPFISVKTLIDVFKPLPNDSEMLPELFEKIPDVFETFFLFVTLPDMFESLLNMFLTPPDVVGILPDVSEALLDF